MFHNKNIFYNFSWVSLSSPAWEAQAKSFFAFFVQFGSFDRANKFGLRQAVRGSRQLWIITVPVHAASPFECRRKIDSGISYPESWIITRQPSRTKQSLIDSRAENRSSRAKKANPTVSEALKAEKKMKILSREKWFEKEMVWKEVYNKRKSRRNWFCLVGRGTLKIETGAVWFLGGTAKKTNS